jgi:hypothetical protein
VKQPSEIKANTQKEISLGKRRKINTLIAPFEVARHVANCSEAELVKNAIRDVSMTFCN